MVNRQRPGVPAGSWDPGLQNERTALAWTRTGLALVVGVCVMARLALERVGAVTVVLLLVGRYGGAHRALTARSPLPDGRLPAAVVAVVLLLGLAEAVHLLAR